MFLAGYSQMRCHHAGLVSHLLFLSPSPQPVADCATGCKHTLKRVVCVCRLLPSLPALGLSGGHGQTETPVNGLAGCLR